jgi:Protein of unknown function (DUF5131)
VPRARPRHAPGRPQRLSRGHGHGGGRRRDRGRLQRAAQGVDSTPIQPPRSSGARARPLLRRNLREALARRPWPRLRAWLRPAAPAAAAAPAARLDGAAHDLRQQHERPLPRRRSAQLHRPGVGRHGQDAAAHVPGAHQAHRANGAGVLHSDRGSAAKRLARRQRRVARLLRRIRHLQRTPAAVHFLGCEPLLAALPNLPLEGIDWAIVGGENGPGARPLREPWVEEIIARCQAAGPSVFVKQLGTVWAGAGPATARATGWSSGHVTCGSASCPGPEMRAVAWPCSRDAPATPFLSTAAGSCGWGSPMIARA